MKRKNLPGPSREDLKQTANNDLETTTDFGSKTKLGRRGFLKIGAGAAAGAALGTPTALIAQRRSGAAVQARLSGECNDVPFSEPKAVFACANNGKNVLEYYLSAEPLNWTFTCGSPDPQTGMQPVFNGALPGPSLYVDPGTSLNLTLKNNLGEFKFSGDNCPAAHHATPPQPACFQHTNLHVHGLQVSPCSLKSDGQLKCGPYAIDGQNPPLKFSSDDVLVDIYPGQTNQYSIVLPDMHAPGTNWYHSHLHGASAYQVSGGMAGAIIIREPTPEARMVREDLDKVFVLQEIIPNTTPLPAFPPVYGSIPNPSPSPTSTPTPTPTPPPANQVVTQVFVNGLCRPTLKMKTGQTMRWRIINTSATPNGLMTLRLVKSDTCSSQFPKTVPPGEVMFLMAIDGLSFYGVNPQPVRYHIMGNGNRADFLVNLKEPGLYTLLKDAFPLESVQDPTGAKHGFTFASGGSKQVLMYIDVEQSTYDEKIPGVIKGNKPDYLKAIWSVDCVRAEPVKFQNTMPRVFQIDDHFYEAKDPGIQVPLNTAQEWTLQNIAGAKAPQSNAHPFHVHLNPFQILGVPFDFEVTDADRQKYFPKVPKMDPDNPDTWPFWDTVPLPGQLTPGKGDPGELKIRSRFLIYDGEYVTHCHILVHEDVGMMINVKLNGDGIGPGEAVHDYPPDARACIDRTSRPGVPLKPCPSPSPTPTPTGHG